MQATSSAVMRMVKRILKLYELYFALITIPFLSISLTSKQYFDKYFVNTHFISVSLN